MKADQTPKKQLGRGLSALLGDARPGMAPAPAGGASAANAGAPTVGPARGIRTVPVGQLVPSPFQPRRLFAPTELDELIQSVKAQGVLQPILVRRHPTDAGKFEIIAGERRWRAAQAAQLHEIPALVRDLTDREALEAALVENLQREDLNAIEEAVAYRRLLDEFGHTQDEVAKGLGKSRSYVANIVRLLDLPEEVQELLKSGALTPGHARLLVGLDNAVEIAKHFVSEGLTVRQAEAHVNGLKEQRAGKTKSNGSVPRAEGSADTRALERSLAQALGLKVQIQSDKGGKSGTLAIQYQTLDQLDDLLAKLTGVPKI